VGTEEHDRRRCSFGGIADAYERYRPRYPADAVSWLRGMAPRFVLDLAAGTGKLTEALLEAGHEVVAVEPDPGMRAVFAEARPGVPIHAGTAEQIPLPDRSVDAVAIGQAWHWFDPPRALPELARVLRPAGTLAILWNSRDESVPLVAELGAVLDGHDATSGTHGVESAEQLGPEFSQVERADFHHVQLLDVEALVGLVASRSYTITLAAPERTEMLARVEEIGRRESLRSPDGVIRLPYVTVCLRALSGT
jgi:SAM-dependent methyltransferase